jgi:malonyl CoA-acyl carrier protein transacylase
MASCFRLADTIVEEVCASIDGIVVAANYNCPGQLVISGEYKAVELACKMKEVVQKSLNFTSRWRFPPPDDGASQRGTCCSN